MYRVFIEKFDHEKVSLAQDEVHHLVRVRRAKSGDSFLGLDGKGKIFLCRLQRNDQEWSGRIIKVMEERGESNLKVILGQALLKKNKFEFVIQKATELGVTEIVPLITERTEVRLDDFKIEKRMKRWNKVLMESVKQTGRTSIPELSFPVPLKKFLTTRSAAVEFFLDENQGMPLVKLISGNQCASSCLTVVGPEGGWAEQDRRIFDEHRLIPVHIGPRILRSETTPLVTLSILQYEFGDLGN